MTEVMGSLVKAIFVVFRILIVVVTTVVLLLLVQVAGVATLH